jgi:hypothetical protein
MLNSFAYLLGFAGALSGLWMGADLGDEFWMTVPPPEPVRDGVWTGGV